MKMNSKMSINSLDLRLYVMMLFWFYFISYQLLDDVTDYADLHSNMVPLMDLAVYSNSHSNCVNQNDRVLIYTATMVM